MLSMYAPHLELQLMLHQAVEMVMMNSFSLYSFSKGNLLCSSIS